MTDLPGRPASRPQLIVNADDFGQSSGINQGVARAHLHGIVTSASLMVRWPSSKDAAEYARDHPDLSLGLHVDLGEWVYRQDWSPLYKVVATENVRAVGREVSRQLKAFRNLTGRDPTHIDSHQHVHRSAALLPLFRAVALDTGSFLREDNHRIRYDGRFYGWDGRGAPLPEAIQVDALMAIIASLPPGFTELGCHPGLMSDMISPYRSERTVETQTLCDPKVASAILYGRAELASFHDADSG